MVIVMQKGAAEEKIEHVMAELTRRGFDVHRSTGSDHTVLGVVGDVAPVDPREFELFDGVQEVVRISEPYKLSSRSFRRENTVVQVGNTAIGGKEVVVMAGPCTIEVRIRGNLQWHCWDHARVGANRCPRSTRPGCGWRSRPT